MPFCNICWRGYPINGNHLSSKIHKRPIAYYCGPCQLGFNTKMAEQRHRESTACGPWGYRCWDCNSFMGTEAKYGKHLKSGCPKKNNRPKAEAISQTTTWCKFCNKDMKTAAMLQNHFASGFHRPPPRASVQNNRLPPREPVSNNRPPPMKPVLNNRPPAASSKTLGYDSDRDNHEFNPPSAPAAMRQGRVPKKHFLHNYPLCLPDSKEFKSGESLRAHMESEIHIPKQPGRGQSDKGNGKASESFATSDGSSVGTGVGSDETDLINVGFSGMSLAD